MLKNGTFYIFGTKLRFLYRKFQRRGIQNLNSNNVYFKFRRRFSPQNLQLFIKNDLQLPNIKTISEKNNIFGAQFQDVTEFYHLARKAFEPSSGLDVTFDYIPNYSNSLILPNTFKINSELSSQDLEKKLKEIVNIRHITKHNKYHRVVTTSPNDSIRLFCANKTKFPDFTISRVFYPYSKFMGDKNYVLLKRFLTIYGGINFPLFKILQKIIPSSCVDEVRFYQDWPENNWVIFFSNDKDYKNFLETRILMNGFYILFEPTYLQYQYVSTFQHLINKDLGLNNKNSDSINKHYDILCAGAKNLRVNYRENILNILSNNYLRHSKITIDSDFKDVEYLKNFGNVVERKKILTNDIMSHYCLYPSSIDSFKQFIYENKCLFQLNYCVDHVRQSNNQCVIRVGSTQDRKNVERACLEAGNIFNLHWKGRDLHILFKESVHAEKLLFSKFDFPNLIFRSCIQPSYDFNQNLYGVLEIVSQVDKNEISNFFKSSDRGSFLFSVDSRVFVYFPTFESYALAFRVVKEIGGKPLQLIPVQISSNSEQTTISRELFEDLRQKTTVGFKIYSESGSDRVRIYFDSNRDYREFLFTVGRLRPGLWESLLRGDNESKDFSFGMDYLRWTPVFLPYESFGEKI